MKQDESIDTEINIFQELIDTDFDEVDYNPHIETDNDVDNSYGYLES